MSEEPKRRLWPLVTAVIVIIAAAVALAPYLLSRLAPRTVHGAVSGDSLDIRLVGVRPDNSDDIYNAAGEKIGVEKWFVSEFGHWDEKLRKRDLVFEMPADAGEVVFALSHPARASEDPDHVLRNLRAPEYAFEIDGRRRFLLLAGFPKLHHRRFMGIFPHEVAVRDVDVTLRYFKGPRGPAAYTFIGPFTPGVAVSDEAGGSSQLIADADPMGHAGRAWFRLTARLNDTLARLTNQGLSYDRQMFPYGLTLLVYDKSGRRRGALRQDCDTSGNLMKIEFSVDGLSPANVAAITLGEAPLERTFHNIRVDYPGRPDRSHAEYLDQMAQTLGLEGLSAKQLDSYWFRDHQEALSVIDIVRGEHALRAWQVIRDARVVDFTALSEDVAARVHAAAKGWSGSPEPRIRIAGVEMGLRCGLREFIPHAFGLLREDDWEIRANAARLIVNSRGLLGESDVPRILEELTRTEEPQVRSYLMRCLRYGEMPGCAEALAGLVEDDRPWLWWEAIYGLQRHKRLGDPADWDEEFRRRAILALGPSWILPGDEESAAAAYRMLPGLLTPQLAYMDYELFSRGVLPNIIERLDKPAATAAMVGFLRTVDEGGNWDGMGFEDTRNWPARCSICLVLRRLNDMHDVDLGDLGTDIDAPGNDEPGRDWRQNAADAVLWYETGVVPGPIAPGYRAAAGDLRIAWLNEDDPEKSAIGTLPAKEAAGGPARLWRLSRGDDFVAWRITPDGSGWSVSLELGKTRGWRERRELGFARSDLPAQLHPATGGGGSTGADWPWQVHLESADSPRSVLSGTKVFADWWEKYGPAASGTQPRDLSGGTAE